MSGNVEVSQLGHIVVQALGLGNVGNLILRKCVVVSNLVLASRNFVVVKVSEATEDLSKALERALTSPNLVFATIIEHVEVSEAE